ncbi:glucose-6-phosphate isomerase [Ketobacter sp.]|uniref:glucose-6-phosphate isomerase n=1 Tax=Ketobacter sp. TaxID=2083498 RepID=UPI0025BA74AD|nr:glucose-6-phosphate isomerase [Ketobacter sp.]
MPSPISSPYWPQLEALRQDFLNTRLTDLFRQQPNRFQQYSGYCQDLFIDYSKHFVDQRVMTALLGLAEQQQLTTAIQRLARAEPLTSGLQTIPYTALRDKALTPTSIAGEDISSLIRDNLFKMERICSEVRSWRWRGLSDKPIADVVTLGVGGAANDAEAVHKALGAYQTNSIRIHFVSNGDSDHFRQLLNQLQPDTTLFIISSKSFATQETIANAQLAREWVLQQSRTDTALQRHFIAITGNKAAALEFGVGEQCILAVWDWLPGRYSLWTAAGLPVALAIGMERFVEFLAGAHVMDRHFLTTEPARNFPVILALLGVWYTNFWQASNHALLPYHESLELLPALVQHCLMEANGKSIDLAGHPVAYQTAPVIWGTAGNSSQHTYFQLLHQGTHTIPADFIAVAREPVAGAQHQNLMQCLAQSEALMLGNQGETPPSNQTASNPAINDQVLPGNKPSTSIIMKQLTPGTLGQLLALYEHIAFTRAIIWNINPFTHWGTELSKRYGNDFSAQPHAHDPSTLGLLQVFKQWNQETDTQELHSPREEPSYYF